MESQPQNPEFRYNPENFHPCISRRSFFMEDRSTNVPLIEIVLLSSHKISFGFTVIPVLNETKIEFSRSMIA